MDHSLNSKSTIIKGEGPGTSPLWLTQSRNFLITSGEFEPFVPQTSHDILYSLQVLGTLGEIARQSLPSEESLEKIQNNASLQMEKSQENRLPAISSSSATPSPSSAGFAKVTPQSVQPKLETPPQKLSPKNSQASTPVHQKHSIEKPKTRQSNDSAIIDALMKLRNSKALQRRTSGIFTSIIRANPK